jgi:lysophospholipase L1-like esterase
MNLENVKLYNVGALEKVPGLGENGLMRLPEKIRNCLNDRARFVAKDSIGCEVQFVTDAPNIDINVSCAKPEFAVNGEIRVFKGNFHYQLHELEPGIVYNIRLSPPPSFPSASKNAINEGGFSSDVWRIICGRGANVVIHGIDTHGHDIRPPEVKELPKLNWLAYGSSITNSNLDGYPHFAARKLRVQVQNQGMSGSCQIEKQLVDYYVDKCEWDFATCELGINMRGSFTPKEFEKRASYLIDRFTATGRPVLIISLFPNHQSADRVAQPGEEATKREEAYNAILEKLVERKNASNLHFISGREVLDDFTGLSADLLHPCPYGHAIMGTNLAKKLEEII